MRCEQEKFRSVIFHSSPSKKEYNGAVHQLFIFLKKYSMHILRICNIQCINNKENLMMALCKSKHVVLL
jgi:hypothetical protein